MKFRKLTLTVFLFLFIANIYAQFPDEVHMIDVKPNSITTFHGNLATGFVMDDLSWASSSNNACFTGLEKHKFTGKHVLHAFKIPPYSDVNITVIPEDKNANFSIYGYQTYDNRYPVVPNLKSCVSCEADFKWDYPKANRTQDHTRHIRFNSLHSPYNIVIGVAGADGLATGSYTLKINLITRVQKTKIQGSLKIHKILNIKGKTLSYEGNLKEGVVIHDLTWASKSSVACFPATQNHKFTGNQLIYTTDLPAHSEMKITLIPDDKSKNMSLYAYVVTSDKNAMIPNLTSCVTCEADYKWDYKKYGKTQNHTRSVHLNSVNSPYKVIIGVAGADGLADGKFTLRINTK